MKHNSGHFKWRHYEAKVILLCVRWYLRYQLTYRDLGISQQASHLFHRISGKDTCSTGLA